jgi:hypothetical protein
MERCAIGFLMSFAAVVPLACINGVVVLPPGPGAPCSTIVRP